MKNVVTGLEDATGEVSVIVNGKTYTAPIKAGEASVIVPGLTETVTAAVNYAGDSNYNNASTAVEIVVNPAPEPGKDNLTISASAEPITVGEDAIIKVVITLLLLLLVWKMLLVMFLLLLMVRLTLLLLMMVKLLLLFLV